MVMQTFSGYDTNLVIPRGHVHFVYEDRRVLEMAYTDLSGYPKSVSGLMRFLLKIGEGEFPIRIHRTESSRFVDDYFNSLSMHIDIAKELDNGI